MNISWQKPQNNRKKIEKLLKDSKPADLIVLPEMFTTGFTMETEKFAETMDGETVQWMKKLSNVSRSVITGSIIIEERGRYYNRLIWMKPDGTLKHYDKRHLFRMAGEDEHFSEGSRKAFPVLKGWRICPLICYDLRFPVWSRNVENYDLLIYVANWPKPRITAWDTLLKARAIENMSYCIGVNRVGIDAENHQYSGHSSVYDSLGELVSNFKEDKEMIEIVTLSKDNLTIIKEKLKFLDDRDRFIIP